MDFLELRIGKELVEKFLKDAGKFESVTLEMEGDGMNIVLTSKVLSLMKIPISLSLKLKDVQSSPEDPLTFTITANRIIMGFIKDFKTSTFEIKENTLYVYPYKIFSMLKKFTIFDVSFEENFISIKMKPHGLLESIPSRAEGE